MLRGSCGILGEDVLVCDGDPVPIEILVLEEEDDDDDDDPAAPSRFEKNVSVNGSHGAFFNVRTWYVVVARIFIPKATRHA